MGASALRHTKQDRVSVAAGAFAYRWFLSLFPAIIALLGIASLIAIPRHVTEDLTHGVTKALPTGAAGVLTEAISQASKQTGGAISTTVIAATVALWSATSGMVMIEEGLDMAFGLPTGDRSFLKKRMLAIPLLIGVVLLGGAASVLVVFGPQLGNAIRGAAPIEGAAFSAGWTALRWVVSLFLMILLFSLLYNLAPNRKQRWQWVSVGAVFGTTVWALVSLAFSFYTSSFDSYDKTYGAFAGVAILIFWLYLTGLALFIGGEINSALERAASNSAPRNSAMPPAPDRPRHSELA